MNVLGRLEVTGSTPLKRFNGDYFYSVHLDLKIRASDGR